MATKFNSGRVLRMAALATSMLAALPAHAQIASSTSKPVKPLYGNIRSFWGNIRSFDSNGVSPYWGNIRSFQGEATPFWGNIRSFWGTDQSPFEGDLAPFWGNIRSFSDPADGVTPAWGNIRSFWGDISPQWGNIRSFWGNIRSFSEDPAAYQQLAGQLGDLVKQSETVWGAVVTAKTGKSFADGFATPLLAKYGIDLANPASLEALPDAGRTLFFIDWHDQLMQFSGHDQVDHWMKTANWNPGLTQVQGSGSGTTIGLVDFFVAGDADIRDNIIQYTGVSNFTNGHGAAVASLMVSAHDGRGVMGIAPNAKVAAYNPFDATGTADWAAVRNGIIAVTNKGASVVNLSLGVPGWTLNGDWRGVFSNSAVKDTKDKAIYVLAAGNDGITQTTSINMKDGFDTTFLVVGSVDANGTISSFSNRPGKACLLDGSDCKDDPSKQLNDQLKESSLLMRRFLVAPGEMILVSDDKGGVTRASGTSFAAPLVSGAIALLHDRWPWLKKYPRDAATIILSSAKDLGAPGVDEVYGAGMLDVEASQAPLNFAQLKYYLASSSSTSTTEVKVSTLTSTGLKPIWDTSGLYFSAFQKTESTEIDFLIPLSSRLVGTTRNGEYFQDYVYSRMTDWLAGKTSLAGGPRFSNFADYSAPVANPYGLNLSMQVANRNPALGYRQGGVPVQSSLRLATPGDRFAVRLGYGDGSVALGRQQGFGLFSDYDQQSGGVNPLLGMASGDGYAAVEAGLTEGLRLSLGTSNRNTRLSDDRRLSALQRLELGGIGAYKVGAQNVSLDYQLTRAFALSASYTKVREKAGLLGVQSIDPTDLQDGATTEGLTLGADWLVAGDLRLSASGTLGRTREGGRGRQNIAVSSGGLVSSAAQVALTKSRLFGKGDRIRLSVSQPMHLEKGSIDFSSVKVIDRETGEIGVVTERLDIAQRARRYVAEVLYASPLLGGQAEMSLFGRAELRPSAATTEDTPAMMAGTRLRLAF